MKNCFNRFRIFSTVLIALAVAFSPMSAFASNIHHLSMMNKTVAMENCHKQPSLLEKTTDTSINTQIIDNKTLQKTDNTKDTKANNCCSFHFVAFALPNLIDFAVPLKFEGALVFSQEAQLTSNLNFFDIEPPRTTYTL